MSSAATGHIYKPLVQIFSGVVTCKIKLFQNHFSLRRRQYEIIIFQGVWNHAQN